MEQKFQVGCKVSVLDDVIIGTITSVEKHVITIEDQDGFLRHFQPQELVLLQSDVLLENLTISNKDKKAKQIKTIAKTKKPQKNTSIEVDLHIHQITHSNKNMQNFEMLTKQINTAKYHVEKAIKENKKTVIFIHGKGQGVLKKELYIMLQNYPVIINDASFKKYGYGATEVVILRSKINRD